MNPFSKRLKRIREIRGYTQKELAEKSGINVVTIQFYEYGTRHPRDEQLKKLAEALLVHISFLRSAEWEEPDVLIYNLMERYGHVEFEPHGAAVAIMVPEGYSQTFNFNTSLYEIMRAKESGLTDEEFKMWLLNHYYGSMVRVGAPNQKIHPELDILPKPGTIPPKRIPSFQDKFIAVMGTERKLEEAVDLAYHAIVDGGTDEGTKKILDKLLHDVRNLVDDDKAKYD